MKVKVAETAGFCFGVKRAVDKVYELIGTEQKPIFTLGPIIHNEGVVADLEARGVHVITEADLDSPDDTLQNGTVVWHIPELLSLPWHLLTIMLLLF